MTSLGQVLAATSGASDVLQRLRVTVGANVWISDAIEDLERHSLGFVGSHAKGRPLAVAYPKTTKDVAEILRFCHAERLAVIPQGGLTGLVGGGFALGGELILSTERMRAIEEVDVAASIMLVQAGVPLQRVQEEALRNGLSFPLDYGSRGSCLVGGMLSTNAGGNRVIKFGMARDLVLGLEVVLADGTVVSSLNRMIKNNTGHDLKQLFIGTEGTLGIITRAVLRLHPAPRSSSVLLCAASSYGEILKLLTLVRAASGSSVSAFEVMWNDFYAAAVSIRAKAPLPATHSLYALIEVSGSDESTEMQWLEKVVGEAYEQGIVEDAVIAKSAAECAEFWAIRDASGEMERIFGRCVTFDVSVPIGAIDDFINECRQRLAQEVPGARALAFGHIADSNIHLACRVDAQVQPKAAIERVVYECVARWSGSVSAEHGIGFDKKSYLHLSRNPEEIALMWVIKRALDPLNILNPGKLLPEGHARGAGQ